MTTSAEPSISLAELAKIELGPNDVLLVRMPGDADELRYVHKLLTETLQTDRPILVVPSDISIEALSINDLPSQLVEDLAKRVQHRVLGQLDQTDRAKRSGW